jgi:hypothetical protein
MFKKVKLKCFEPCRFIEYSLIRPKFSLFYVCKNSTIGGIPL